MVIVVFRTHVKPQADLEKLNALNQKMVALVSKMPGFLSIQGFFGTGRRVSSNCRVRFPRARGRLEGASGAPRGTTARAGEEFFTDYRIQVCNFDPHFGLHSRIQTIVRERSWNLDGTSLFRKTSKTNSSKSRGGFIPTRRAEAEWKGKGDCVSARPKLRAFVIVEESDLLHGRE